MTISITRRRRHCFVAFMDGRRIACLILSPDEADLLAEQMEGGE